MWALLPGMFDRLQVTARKMNGWFPEDLVETFRRHVWVNPFWEDQVDDVIGAVGTDRVIFGSDWPHIEALPEPLDYVREVRHLPETNPTADPYRQGHRPHPAPARLTRVDSGPGAGVEWT